MKKIDFNCFAGTWPFHKLRVGTLEEMTRLHQKHGITGGVFSSLNAIFYQDPYEGDLDLARQLKGTKSRQYLTVNPLRIGYLEDAKRGLEELKPMGIRIYPGLHGYALREKKLEPLCRLLLEEHLPLVITQRMEDERITHLIHPQNPTGKEWQAFLEEHPTLTVLITHIRTAELLSIQEVLKKRQNVFFDASGVNRSPFPFEDLMATGVEGQMVFGSNAPLQSFSGTLQALLSENLPKDFLSQAFGGKNFLACLDS